jgi:hypothetical protein
MYGTVEIDAYGAVGLPMSPYSCQVHAYIERQTGWTNSITFYSSASYLGNSYKGLYPGYSANTLVHPICAV